MKPFLLLLVVLVGTGLLVALFALFRARRGTWLRFARLHGLDHGVDPEGIFRVGGTVRGKEIRLDALPAGSDTGLGAVVEERLTVWPGPGLPEGLSLRPLPDPIPGAGDESLEDRAEVTAADPGELDAWLTPERRRALLDLLRHAGPDRAGVEDGAVFLSRRTAYRDLGAIEEDLETLLTISDELA